LVQQSAKQLTGCTPSCVDGGGLTAQPSHDASDVDASSTRVLARRGTAQLCEWRYLANRRRDIDGRINRERNDLGQRGPGIRLLFFSTLPLVGFTV
jgi:hypothetical protein